MGAEGEGRESTRQNTTCKQTHTMCLVSLWLTPTKSAGVASQGRREGREEGPARAHPYTYTKGREHRQTTDTKQAALARAVLAQPGSDCRGNAGTGRLNGGSECQPRHTHAEGRENSIQKDRHTPTLPHPPLPRQYVHPGAEWGR